MRLANGAQSVGLLLVVMVGGMAHLRVVKSEALFSSATSVAFWFISDLPNSLEEVIVEVNPSGSPLTTHPTLLATILETVKAACKVSRQASINNRLVGVKGTIAEGYRNRPRAQITSTR